MHREVRLYDIAHLEIERRADGKGATIRGHASVFNTLSVMLCGLFRERILPGAFAEAIAGDDVRALWNHNTDLVLGRNVNGSLRLSEDKVGLAFELDLPDTQAGRDALALIERRDVSQMSFGFNVPPDGARWTVEEEVEIREVLKVRPLYDVSPVAFPAYPETDVSLRTAYSAALEELEARQAEKSGRSLAYWRAKHRQLSTG